MVYRPRQCALSVRIRLQGLNRDAGHRRQGQQFVRQAKPPPATLRRPYFRSIADLEGRTGVTGAASVSLRSRPNPSREVTYRREIHVSRCAPQAFVASASLHAFSRRPATSRSPRPVPKPLDGLGAVADPPAFRWGRSAAVFERPAQTVLSACASILALLPGELVL
jgi:hypothetical protein